jgi:hypothetical protein
MYSLVFIVLLSIFGFSTDDIWTFFEPSKQINPIDNIRIEAQRILEQDLINWEKEWNQYSPSNSFAKFVSDKPDFVHGVFWDAFNYMDGKVNAGRNAYSIAIQNGASIEEARKAYFEAAKMPRNELVSVNEQFNIKHGLANIEDQRMFKDGKYIYREN